MRKTHGETTKNSRLYRIWAGMKARCNNPKNPRFYAYGGKGITVCTEWLEYLPFKQWALTHGYSDSLTLDRINNTGNYCPENCRWANELQQKNNMRNNIILECYGEKHTLSEWARIKGIRYHTLQTRFYRGWSIEKMLSNTPQKQRRN